MKRLVFVMFLVVMLLTTSLAASPATVPPPLPPGWNPDGSIDWSRVGTNNYTIYDPNSPLPGKEKVDSHGNIIYFTLTPDPPPPPPPHWQPPPPPWENPDHTIDVAKFNAACVHTYDARSRDHQKHNPDGSFYCNKLPPPPPRAPSLLGQSR